MVSLALSMASWAALWRSARIAWKIRRGNGCVNPGLGASGFQRRFEGRGQSVELRAVMAAPMA